MIPPSGEVMYKNGGKAHGDVRPRHLSVIGLQEDWRADVV